MGKELTAKIVITGFITNVIEDLAGEALDDPSNNSCTWASKYREAEQTEVRVTGRLLPTKVVHLTRSECSDLGKLIKRHRWYDAKNVTYQSPRHEQNAWINLHKLWNRLREAARALETGVE